MRRSGEVAGRLGIPFTRAVSKRCASVGYVACVTSRCFFLPEVTGVQRVLEHSFDAFDHDRPPKTDLIFCTTTTPIYHPPREDIRREVIAGSRTSDAQALLEYFILYSVPFPSVPLPRLLPRRAQGRTRGYINRISFFSLFSFDVPQPIHAFHIRPHHLCSQDKGCCPSSARRRVHHRRR